MPADIRIHKKILDSAGIHNEILDSGTTTLVISNNEMETIMKIVKSLLDSGLLIKGLIETIQNEAKKQKGIFPIMLLGTLDVSLLGNMLVGKGINRAGYGSKHLHSNKGKGIIRAGYGSKLDFQYHLIL